jgi:hypothetical protein
MSGAGKLVGALKVLKGVELPDYTPSPTTRKFYNKAGVLYWGDVPISGTGTVVLVTADELIPLFTVTVINPDTEPEIVFALKTVAAHKVLIGPVSGADAAWGARLLVASDLPDLSGVYQAALGYDPENVANKATNPDLGTSDVLYPSQAAVKSYVDAHGGASGALIFKGAIDCSGNPNYPAANKGDVYVVSVAGKIGGASGVAVELGDTMYCEQDATASGNQATVGAYWVIVQANIDGAVIGPATSTDQHIAIFSGVSGKLIADGGVLISALATCLANYASGPASSVNNRLAAFSGTGGKTLIDAGVLISALVLQGLFTASGLTLSTNNRILGRWTAGAGAAQEIQLGANMNLTAAGLLEASGGGGGLTGVDVREVMARGGI